MGTLSRLLPLGMHSRVRGVRSLHSVSRALKSSASVSCSPAVSISDQRYWSKTGLGRSRHPLEPSRQGCSRASQQHLSAQ